jgi:hypothetical protein
MPIRETRYREMSELQSAGFVRVDGLEATVSGVSRVINNCDIQNIGRIGISARRDMGVVYTEDGQIWLSVGKHGQVSEWFHRSEGPVGQFLRYMCPQGDGAEMPIKEGEDLDWRDLMRRHSNPYYKPKK